MANGNTVFGVGLGAATFEATSCTIVAGSDGRAVTLYSLILD
ncbi:hypothetical protein [Nocardia sp. NBC_01327]|nr:hypothetical protein OG326_38920 [Nocardia sp. NBC_01327]